MTPPPNSWNLSIFPAPKGFSEYFERKDGERSFPLVIVLEHHGK